MRLCWIRRWRCGVLQLYRGRWLGAAGGSKTFSSVFQFISAREWGTNRMNIQKKLNVGYDDAFISFHKLQHNCLSTVHPVPGSHGPGRDTNRVSGDHQLVDWAPKQGLMSSAMFLHFWHGLVQIQTVQLIHNISWTIENSMVVLYSVPKRRKGGESLGLSSLYLPGRRMPWGSREPS